MWTPIGLQTWAPAARTCDTVNLWIASGMRNHLVGESANENPRNAETPRARPKPLKMETICQYVLLLCDQTCRNPRVRPKTVVILWGLLKWVHGLWGRFALRKVPQPDTYQPGKIARVSGILSIQYTLLHVLRFRSLSYLARRTWSSAHIQKTSILIHSEANKIRMFQKGVPSWSVFNCSFLSSKIFLRGCFCGAQLRYVEVSWSTTLWMLGGHSWQGLTKSPEIQAPPKRVHKSRV